MPSQEERLEDEIKKELEDLKIEFYNKTKTMDKQIEYALKEAPSKGGGSGRNYPDLKLLINTQKMRHIPVMIEIKGLKRRLEKFNKNNASLDMSTDAIKNYALNGAVHYANAILDYSDYKEVIAIGINGYEEADKLHKEYAFYYLQSKALAVPQKIGDFSDLSILTNLEELEAKLDTLTLSDEVRAKAIEDLESQTETQLNKLNQFLHDEILNLDPNDRVALLVGMIMAASGVAYKTSPLKLEDLKNEQDKDSHDGHEFLKKIKAFLNAKNLPPEKISIVVHELQKVFIHSKLWQTNTYTRKNIAISPLKTIYGRFLEGVFPLVKKLSQADIAGKLFNVLTKWLEVPDNEKNDVVLTPRIVVDLMVNLAEVNQDSFVWDYATGSGAFLVSSMNKMIQDCTEKILNQEEREKKIAHIRAYQLLGIEKRTDIYLLGVLNMLLLGDGSANLLHKDSLVDFKEGVKYEQGDYKGKLFNANVFLLNPPYSAKGKGFVFVDRALERMTSGRAVVIIQENAGSGNGLPYTKDILKKNTLLASIKMPLDLFVGKSSVQTAIYVFEVGKPHNKEHMVKFINFSNDGYMRAARKKAKASVNLRDVDRAKERYAELINIIVHDHDPKLYKDHFIKDRINLGGEDWTYAQHQKIDNTPQITDFKRCVADFLTYEVSLVLKGDSLTQEAKA
ncbi:HsdM family class I SAM-dependent methyltransferase [Helicobacter suis]|uniref:site-specific DNA-methyltransferase (adenine-specific) n=2 Tax=Helicobacter suis TaxID=104628 RepID=E7G342_9HELI|nr:N-6 DNA methylase [Helicobacter suis]EFX42206.1 type IIS restriction enzyme [Helicobacter suis HS5]EFX43468.1 type II restriction modification enzyme methyltransferase [Helicobacter suis HS1]BCD47238.1 Type IIS restriction enzyme M protein Mod [Helicobacter suis]BCD48993.1 Type IIS restriction enzyme M protein Mod [Helicobacter suis]BCD50779.1 Type IIS restriction enzyme M protein Mod [Helicobacter suis]